MISLLSLLTSSLEGERRKTGLKRDSYLARGNKKIGIKES